MGQIRSINQTPKKHTHTHTDGITASLNIYTHMSMTNVWQLWLGNQRTSTRSAAALISIRLPECSESISRRSYRKWKAFASSRIGCWVTRGHRVWFVFVRPMLKSNLCFEPSTQRMSGRVVKYTGNKLNVFIIPYLGRSFVFDNERQSAKSLTQHRPQQQPPGNQPGNKPGNRRATGRATAGQRPFGRAKIYTHPYWKQIGTPSVNAVGGNI